jgi:hypothetical protein
LLYDIKIYAKVYVFFPIYLATLYCFITSVTRMLSLITIVSLLLLLLLLLLLSYISYLTINLPELENLPAFRNLM